VITADTITDEQIRELLIDLRGTHVYTCNRCGHRDMYHSHTNDMRACYAALSTVEIHVSTWTKDTARAHCAEILNARTKEPTK
jgi:DNA-directed RNA polymerase subunit RPC12/RpoP